MKDKLFNFNNFIYFIFPFTLLEIFFLQFITAAGYILDYSYIVIGLISLYFLFGTIDKFNKIKLRANKKLIFLNLILLFAYSFLISSVYEDHVLLVSLPVRIVLMILSLSVIFTSIFSFIDLNVLKAYKFELFVYFPLSFIVITYPTMNYILWDFLSSSTCKIVTNALFLFGYKNVSLINGITIMNPDFKITIFAGCSGLEGITFFMAAFSFYLISISNRSLKPDYIFISYFLGILYMYLLNAFRIFIYFIFGVSMVNKLGSLNAAKSVVNLFHSNVGWVIYFLGILIYIGIWSFVARRKKFSI